MTEAAEAIQDTPYNVSLADLTAILDERDKELARFLKTDREQRHIKGRPVATKVAQVLFEIRRVSKEGKHKYFEYATADDLFEEIRGKLGDVGVAVFPDVLELKTSKLDADWRECRVVLSIMLVDGESGDTMTSNWHGHAMDKGDKAPYKAYTMAMKYWARSTFLLSTGEGDVEADPEVPFSNNGHPNAPSSNEVPGIQTKRPNKRRRPSSSKKSQPQAKKPEPAKKEKSAVQWEEEATREGNQAQWDALNNKVRALVREANVGMEGFHKAVKSAYELESFSHVTIGRLLKFGKKLADEDVTDDKGNNPRAKWLGEYIIKHTSKKK